MFFSDSEIPEDTKKAVLRLSARGRLPQCIMLTGGTSALREKCAGELCAAVLCVSPKNGEPCGKCRACLKIKGGVHPDVITVTPPKDRKNVTIDALRKTVLDTLYISPNEAENKIYVFPEAQELSAIIQNALLKSIEEPPEFVMFIFQCEQREKMLETVISRSTELTLGDTLSAKSKKEDADVTKIACSVLDAFCGFDEYALMLATAAMNKNRKLMKKTAVKIITVLRDAMCEISGAPLLSGCERQAVMLSSRFSLSELLAAKEAMEKIIEYADKNANENLLVSQFSSMLGVIFANKKS